MTKLVEKKKRLDTSLESEGAEFLVLGMLLLNKMPCYKAYTRNPKYDLMVINPEKNISATIQVKSRYASDSNMTFPTKNFESDFFVFALLNRGNIYSKKKIDAPPSDPQFYVVPTAVVLKNKRPNIVRLREIENYETYLNAWHLLKGFLKYASNKKAPRHPLNRHPGEGRGPWRGISEIGGIGFGGVDSHGPRPSPG